jgi:hypothetical protein
MDAAPEAAQPITGRGIGYRLFTAGLISSKERQEMQRVYRLLRQARQDGIIPWDRIVDETRSPERTSTDPEQYARCVARSTRPTAMRQLLDAALSQQAKADAREKAHAAAEARLKTEHGRAWTHPTGECVA